MSFPFLQPYAGLSNSLQTAQAAAGGINWDYQQDYDSSVTAQTGNMSVSSGVMNWNAVANGGTNGFYDDMLGTTISDTAFVFRNIVTIDNLNNPSSETQIYNHGVLGSTHHYINTSNRGDGLVFGLWNNSSGSKQIRYGEYDENWAASIGNNGTKSTPMSVDTFYEEIIRQTATSADFNLYTDDTYGTSLEDDTLTISSSNNNLRYNGGHNWNRSAVGNGHDGTQDTTRLMDGVTSV